MPPRPFTIAVPDAVLTDLGDRLARTRWPDVIPGTGWEYGVDLAYVRELCEYWRTTFNWREQEAALNQHPQFLCEVDGLDIHFWHVKGKGPNPFPLLLVHGWPGSMYEFHRLIGPLTDPAAHGGDPADAFDVVIPALPGFGFGGKPQEPGWNITRIAAAFDHLMANELGYTRYGTQGGDWGGIITARMGSAHANHIAGVHLNFIPARPSAAPAPGATEPDEEREARAHRDAFQANETGYSLEQGTKPTTVALAQADSPAGLAAWIIEKFRTWSDCEGDIERVYTKDQLLTNVMFYWAPNSIASAANIYFEARRDRGAFGYPRVEVPVAVAAFPHEIYRSPRSWVEPQFNVTRWTTMPRGGHFAALEQPQALLEDIRAFFHTIR